MFGRGFPGGFGRWKDSFLERGDLKYVVLELLKEKPRHGYDIIRALEERFRGLYTPSPGAVYPTLQMLEEMGFASSAERDGKRVYTITEAGLAFLAERGDVVNDIRDRLGKRWGPEFCHETRELTNELRELGRLFKHEWHGRGVRPDQLQRIRDVIVRAHREIKEILAEGRAQDEKSETPSQPEQTTL